MARNGSEGSSQSPEQRKQERENRQAKGQDQPLDVRNKKNAGPNRPAE